METGAITDYIDVAQIVLYLFWIFFAGLVIYLVQENKREGYPLQTFDNAQGRGDFFPPIPSPKTFHLPHGGTKSVPDFKRDERPINGVSAEKLEGSPIEPKGNPMLSGVGPGAWAERAEVPDLTLHGDIKIVPMRVANDFAIADEDKDPRGMAVIGGDGKVAGKVADLWVDRAEQLIRYIEVETRSGRRVLAPMTMSVIWNSSNKVVIGSIFSDQFDDVPATAHPESVTLREEDRICAYYGAGTLFASPDRRGPLL